MKFGPAEMAQMMDSAKALITVTIVSGVGIGIALGVIVGLYRIFFRHRAADHFRHPAADQSFQSEMPTVPALSTVPALPIDATAPHSIRSRVPRANNLRRLVDLLGIIILIAIAGGGFFSYYTSKRSDFEATYNNQLGIQPPPIYRAAAAGALRFRGNLQATRHSTIALDRRATATDSESTCAAKP